MYRSDDGAPVYGVWLHPDEYQEPVVLKLRSVCGSRGG
jgi:hypothetical protein